AAENDQSFPLLHVESDAMENLAFAVTNPEIAERNRWSLRIRRGCDWIAHLLASQEIEQSGENQVHCNHKKNRHDDGGSCRAPNLFGARASGKPFLAADGGDSDAKHEAFDEPAHDVAEEKRVYRSVNVTPKSEAGLSDSKERAAQNAHSVRPSSQTRKHDPHGDELRCD